MRNEFEGGDTKRDDSKAEILVSQTEIVTTEKKKFRKEVNS